MNVELTDAIAGDDVGLAPAQLRNVRAAEFATRFGFGCAAGAIAGAVSILFGNRAGGLFLAFPAILPASLTLIAHKDGDREASTDAAGATIGALSLMIFAATSLLLLGLHVPVVVVGVCALVSWMVGAFAVYFVARAIWGKKTS